MTSEVVIMNRRAVVLAADSAITVTSVVNGQVERRFFKGANKVFELSHHQPVGVMFFNNADLHSVPWEVVIKMYREHLGKDAHATVEDYAKDLFSFLEKHPNLFPQAELDQTFQADATYTAVQLLNELEASAQVSGAPPASKDAARLAEFSAMSQTLAGLGLPGHFGPGDLASATTKFQAPLEAALSTILQSRGVTIPAAHLATAAIESLIKRYDRFIELTGIVVAGYGKDEFFPSFVQYNTYGLLLGKLVADRSPESRRVTPSGGSHVQAFASDEMVYTFMAGISKDVLNGVVNDFEASLTALADDATVALGAASLPDRDKMVKKRLDELCASLLQAQVQRHFNPLIRIVESLPLDEMANLAETLVMLESLKEKVTRPTETVGGPVDVAVITKSEGLVWTRRKHYFEASLNPKFAERQRNRMI